MQESSATRNNNYSLVSQFGVGLWAVIILGPEGEQEVGVLSGRVGSSGAATQDNLINAMVWFYGALPLQVGGYRWHDTPKQVRRSELIKL